MPAIAVSPFAAPPLVRDYLAGELAVAGFFSGHPADPLAYRRKAAEVDARLTAGLRRRLAGAFRPLSGEAAGKLERVLDGEGYFVTTGQQTGLFTGPLYTTYKALSAIRLATALEDLLAKPVLALFWCAADDHDWQEVSHTTVLDEQDYPQRLGLRERGDEQPVPMAERPLDSSVQLALDRLRELMPASAHRDRYIQLLRRAYSPARTMAAAFEDALAAVLEGQAVALVSSAHPLVKQHSGAVLVNALAHAGRDGEQVAQQTERLVRAGYHAQVSVATGASNVFFSDELGRDRLLRSAEGWSLRRTRRDFSNAELQARLTAEPERFSPNVLLRPVVESALFPTLAYVGGPAETSYFAQIGCLFRAHGIMPPVVVPRHSITLVEPPVSRTLATLGMKLAELQQPLDGLLDGVMRRELPAAVTDELARLRDRTGNGFDALVEATAEVTPGMRSPLAGARRRALAQIDALESKIVRHMRREQVVRFEQLRRAAAMVWPDDSPQERTLNLFPYLARYGPDLVGHILAAIPVALDGNHPGFEGVDCASRPLAALSTGGIA